MSKKTLHECAIITMGQSPNSKSYNGHGDGLPFYQGNADFGEINPIRRYYCNKPSKIANRNDILLSVRAPIGAVNIAVETCCIGRGLCAISEKRDITYYKYLYYFLLSRHTELNSKGTGSTFKAISKSILLELYISLPPIEEQKRISRILDKVNDLISLKKKQISKLDLLVKSRFVEMFGDVLHSEYETQALDKIADIGSSKRIYASEYVDYGIPFYRSKEIRELGDGERPSVELFITKERYSEIKVKYGIPSKGDILIAAIGATIGYMWVIDTDQPFYYKDGNLILISNIKAGNALFFQEVLKQLIEEYKRVGVSGSAQLALTIEKVEKMRVPIPPIDLQNQFADFVQQVDKLEFELQKSLNELTTLYNALMQKYFG